MSIGKRLREVRGDLSQHEFATRVGSSKAAVGSYENDKQMPGSAFIMAVGDAFGVEYRWLLKGEGRKHMDSPSDLNGANKKIEELEANVSRLREELKELSEGKIKELEKELELANMERDKAKEEAYKIMKAALKHHMPEIDD